MSQRPVKLNVTKRGNVAIIEMDAEDNRINLDFFDKWNEALDKVESWPDVKALVSTGAGRFYSNGIDLNFVRTSDYKISKTFIAEFEKFLHRLMCFPMVTIAAINGHCFAGGVMLSVCHDYRVMHNGKGWFCMNEVDLGLVFEPYMLRILQLKFTKSMMRAVLFGTRLPAKEALQLSAIDKVAEPGNALEEAIEMAYGLTKNQRYTRDALHFLKMQCYGYIFGDGHASKL